MDLICSRKDANASRVLESKQMGEILCFIFLAASREFWNGSAICVTEVFRIKKQISQP
jgi:hypothetical protein